MLFKELQKQLQTRRPVLALSCVAWSAAEGPFPVEDKVFAADFRKDLNSLAGEEGIQGSLAEHLGYRMLATVQVVTASYHECSWCWLHRGEGHSWYLQFSPLGQLATSWWEWKALFPPGRCFLVWVCDYQQFQLWQPFFPVWVVAVLQGWGYVNGVVSVPLLNQIWTLIWFWPWMKTVFCTRNYFVSKVKRDVAKVQDVHAVTQIVLHTSLAVFWVQKTIPCKTSILYSPQDLLVESLLWHLLSRSDLEQGKVLEGWQWRNVNSCCLSTS